MLTPSKKIYYALEAVLYIAYNAKLSPVSVSAVAEAQGKPTRYLEPVLQRLVRAGILKSVRGPTGGYMLGRERRNITLADICKIATTATLPACETQLGEKVLKPALLSAMMQWQTSLGNVTLAGLCDEARTKNISAIATSPHRFHDLGRRV